MTKINQHQRAALGWDVLTQVAINNNKIRYGELGKRIGIHHRAVKWALERIQDYCLINQLPPLTILVVNETQLPGPGFIAWDIDDIDQGLQQVYNYNWSNLGNPFGYAKKGVTESEIINALLDNPDNAQETYAKIKVRGTAQPLFRKALLQAYDRKCAFCDFGFEVALQASHIVPWSRAKKTERLDIRNGILLCATHHKLFDEDLLKINDDYSINYIDIEKNERVYSEYDILLTAALHNKKMNLPLDRKHWPKKSFLARNRKGIHKKNVREIIKTPL